MGNIRLRRFSFLSAVVFSLTGLISRTQLNCKALRLKNEVRFLNKGTKLSLQCLMQSINMELILEQMK